MRVSALVGPSCCACEGKTRPTLKWARAAWEGEGGGHGPRERMMFSFRFFIAKAILFEILLKTIELV